MGISHPFKRTVRQFTDGEYSEGGRWMYVMHRDFAVEPWHYVRSFVLLQNDLRQLFEYIEPADANLATFSYRVHALLMRACIEVEANCKAILSENGYSVGTPRSWTMVDYRKLEKTHNLSAYEIMVPDWRGTLNRRKPFAAWATTLPNSLPWYQAYNASKHDRHGQFANATFEHLLDAMSGLVALMSAQFHTWDYSPDGAALTFTTGKPRFPGFEEAIGNYFLVAFPANWAPTDQYDFNWQALEKTPNPIRQLIF
jgi:hypothetical protein